MTDTMAAVFVKRYRRRTAFVSRAHTEAFMAPLSIIVTVKQVPDTNEVRIDPKTNSLMREGIPSILNPEDANAVEAALRLRDEHGGTITALTMGPPQAEAVLEEAMCLGVDRAVLLSDRAFAGSDTLLTAFTVSRAVLKLKTFDLILCGRQAIDGDTAQVGPQLAAFLDIPQVTYAEEIVLSDGVFRIQRGLEHTRELVAARPPVLVTVNASGPVARFGSLYAIAAACSGEHIRRWGAKDLNLPPSMLGLSASPTAVKKIFEPDRSVHGEVFEGSEKEMASKLIARLRETGCL
jgi:electron transfer flavoprotein alpha/beta subunit